MYYADLELPLTLLSGATGREQRCFNAEPLGRCIRAGG